MAFPPDLPAQIQDLAARVKTVAGGFFHKLAEIAGGLRDRIPRAVDGLGVGQPGRFRWSRRKVIIASLGGGAVLVLIIAAASLTPKDTPEEPHSAVTPWVAGQGFIPPDELFLPDEPDFVPGVLLEREQRAVWAVDDAVPLWQDPLKNGEEPWRKRVEQAIDEIMESVP